MVRKRSRTASSRRKTYDSEDEDLESDLDSSPPASPEPKRYGLRQRTKKTVFLEEFDDYEEANSSSEDDEYDVEEDLKIVNHNSRKTRLKITPRRKSIQLSMEHDRGEAVTVSVSSIQPIIEADHDQAMDDGPIDFEDMIRADVVVNKKRDEDVLLGKVQKEDEFKKCFVAMDKGRRGRKLKPKPPPPTTSSHSQRQTHEQHATKLEVKIDPSNFVQCETSEPKTNGLRHRKKSQNGSDSIELAPSVLAGIEKFVPPNLDEKEKEVVLSNEYLLGNSFDMTADQFLEAQKHEPPPEDEEQIDIPPINFDENDSDDDVVIIEKKPEIIVLDDD